MIPKIIHYCWFGKGEKSDLTRNCMASWIKFLPEYKIIEWNEDNTNIADEIPYVQEAYNSKKYAFVSDYFRLKALYEYGGVYMDTDYECIKPINDILQSGNFITGFESPGMLLTAFIAVEKHNPIIKEFLDSYRIRHFIEENGSYDLTPINEGFSKLLEKYGVLLDDINLYQKVEIPQTDIRIVVYPVDVLCGFDVKTWHEKYTNRTIGVHHMSSSWQPVEMQQYFRRIKLLQRLLGLKLYDFLKTKIYDRIKRTLKKRQ